VRPTSTLRYASVCSRPGAARSPPAEAATAAGISTGLGAIVPVIPFIFTTGTVAIVTAAVISLVAHFLVGAAKSLVTLRSWWSAGLEMTLAGVIVGGATYPVGLGAPDLTRWPLKGVKGAVDTTPFTIVAGITDASWCVPEGLIPALAPAVSRGDSAKRGQPPT
jgi:hypothetical protein